jgi:general secretion pathway protein F
MPIFFYKAYGPDGKLTEGEIEAVSAKSAADGLWSRRLVAFELAPIGAAKPWWQRELFASKALSLGGRAGFTRELATLTSAGIPLDDTLRLLADQTASAKTRPLAEALLADVLNGAALSDAFAKRAESFPPDYVSIVRAGEIGGKLAQALEELAALLERRAEIRARVQSALVYPVILVALSLVSLGIIVGVLIPNIAPIFGEGGKPVPAAIQILMTLHAHWPAIALAFLLTGGVAGFAAIAALRRPAIRLGFDRFKLRLPVVGSFLLMQETARYSRTLGTLLKAGVPLLQAATSAGAVIGNASLAGGLAAAIEAIREGVPLNQALSRHAGLPPLALRMIAIGEEAAKLDDMLLRVAAMFEQQTQRDIERFMTVFTPAITLFVAIFIGVLIVTIMNAVLSLNDLAVQ